MKLATWNVYRYHGINRDLLKFEKYTNKINYLLSIFFQICLNMSIAIYSKWGHDRGHIFMDVPSGRRIQARTQRQAS